jgi:hypothetical protein
MILFVLSQCYELESPELEHSESNAVSLLQKDLMR